MSIKLKKIVVFINVNYCTFIREILCYGILAIISWPRATFGRPITDNENGGKAKRLASF